MFTWICPECGREVLPAEEECPACAERKKKAAAQSLQAPPVATAGPPPPPPPVQGKPPYGNAPLPAYVPPQQPPPPMGYPPQNYPPQGYPPAQGYPPQGYPYPPQQKAHLPGWLITLLVAGALVAGIAALYLYVLPHGDRTAAAKPSTQMENVGPAMPLKAHPFARHLEITGLRVFEDAKQKVQVKFVLVNHSAADMSGLAATVYLKPTTAKPQDDPILTFSFKAPSIGPFESKELTADTTTKLRAYEMPDWQFMRAEFNITSPQ